MIAPLFPFAAPTVLTWVMIVVAWALVVAVLAERFRR